MWLCRVDGDATSVTNEVPFHGTSNVPDGRIIFIRKDDKHDILIGISSLVRRESGIRVFVVGFSAR
jgi:hypothetical protein